MGRHRGPVIQRHRPAASSNSGTPDQNRIMTSFGDLCTSPGHFALFEAIRFKRHRQTLLLTEAGVDVNCRNSKGLTPLIHAVVNVDDDKSRSKLVKLLLDAGADPNLVDWDGLTALMYAAMYGHPEVVKLILGNKKTNVGIKDPDGTTALMHAASEGQTSVISIFLSSFRDDMVPLRLTNENAQGLTALQLATLSGNDECVRILTREAQIFPKAISGFPDPNILEREPTPLGSNSFASNVYGLSHVHQYSSSLPLAVCPTKDVATNTVRQPAPVLSSEKVSNSSDSEEQETEMVSEHEDSRNDNAIPEDCGEKRSRVKDVRHKATQTTSRWKNYKSPSKRTRILEPISNIENSVAVYVKPYNFAQETESEKLPCRLSGQKTIVHRPNVWQSGSMSHHRNSRRPESEPSALPLIPCNSPLPPVKTNLITAASQKCALRVGQTSLFGFERAPREMDIFKKNLFVSSS